MLGAPISELDIWHGSSDAEPGYVDHRIRERLEKRWRNERLREAYGFRDSRKDERNQVYGWANGARTRPAIRVLADSKAFWDSEGRNASPICPPGSGDIARLGVEQCAILSGCAHKCCRKSSTGSRAWHASSWRGCSPGRRPRKLPNATPAGRGITNVAWSWSGVSRRVRFPTRSRPRRRTRLRSAFGKPRTIESSANPRCNSSWINFDVGGGLAPGLRRATRSQRYPHPPSWNSGSPTDSRVQWYAQSPWH
jgi:hypothetical protein